MGEVKALFLLNPIMKISKLLLSLPAVAAVGLLASPRPVLATDYVWSGAGASSGVGAIGSADWHSARNWKTSGAANLSALGSGAVGRMAGVPGAGDTATISAGANVVINKSLTLAALTIRDGSTLQGTGDITVTSALTLCDAQLTGEGKILISSEGAAILSSQKSGPDAGNILNKSIDNRGALTWASGKLALQKDFTNRGNFTVQSGAILQSIGQAKPVFYNQGTLIKAGNSQSSIDLPFKNSGDIYLRDGVLNAGPNYVQTDGTLNLDGGNLSSAGTLQIDGGLVRGTGTLDCDVVNNGTFKPGHSPGIIYISGNYTQTSNGTLGMEVGGTAPGTGYDQMQVRGSSYLAGNLDIQKYNNYTPYDGLGFEFLVSYDIHNRFTSYTGLYPGNSLFYRIAYSSDRVYATVCSDTTPPTASITTPANGGKYLGVSSVIGLADDNYDSGIKLVTIQLYRYANGSTPAGFLLPNNAWSATYSSANQLSVTGTTSWSTPLPSLPPGQYNVKATVTDNVGRRATSATNVFNISPSGSGYVSLPGSLPKDSWLASATLLRKTKFAKVF